MVDSKQIFSLFLYTEPPGFQKDHNLAFINSPAMEAVTSREARKGKNILDKEYDLQMAIHTQNRNSSLQL